MIASRQCTSSPSRDTFSEKFDTSTGSSKEIAGLKKKKMKNIMMTGIVKSRKNEFWCCKLQVRTIPLGVCVARYGPVSDLWCILKI